MCKENFCPICKKKLLDLATQTIISSTNNTPCPTIDNYLPETLLQPRGSFVTLTVDGQLRGCIGKLTPTGPLYQDVIDNAFQAAFEDYRFDPLTQEELPGLKVEISVLTPRKKLHWQSKNQLFKFLSQNKPGLILEKDQSTATFLPQVWDQLPNAEDFLNHLALKAGLSPSAWIEGHLYTYRAEIIS